ncbi:hypothetical protein [Anabaena azotica]|uniref:Uncharacterized protein n=1 Tax=Anabaena azotica FACHB-119 TaxID=947527 RepID=A0ABR8CY85_9NOST|nr:hypothetical protein [Anabaena azotica]MBD2499875.1 hypothetical protein [Anabaena azotica FACHB-119]
MPNAIDEALQVANNNKNQTVYREENNGKIVLVFKKQFPTPKDDLKLSRLESDIMGAIAKLHEKHSIEIQQIDSSISELKEAIAQLENKKQSLLSSSYVTRLKNEYEKYRQDSVYLSPNLSIYLN